jgi:DNA-binding NarL/FixJ family response regulator
MRVIVADDSLLIREGLIALLDARGHVIVGATDNPESVPALVRSTTPDIALLDIKMPPTFSDEGLRLAAGIRSRHPDVGVLVLSQYLVGSYVSMLVEQSPGRVGYLLKDNVLRPDILEEAMTRVAGGGTFVDPSLVAQLIAADSSLAVLSDRERTILGLVAEGLSDRGIAERLTISLQTVYTHVQHIFIKLDLPASSSDNRRVRAAVTYLTAEHRSE